MGAFRQSRKVCCPTHNDAKAARPARIQKVPRIDKGQCWLGVWGLPPEDASISGENNDCLHWIPNAAEIRHRSFAFTESVSLPSCSTIAFSGLDDLDRDSAHACRRPRSAASRGGARQGGSFG